MALCAPFCLRSASPSLFDTSGLTLKSSSILSLQNHPSLRAPDIRSGRIDGRWQAQMESHSVYLLDELPSLKVARLLVDGSRGTEQRSRRRPHRDSRQPAAPAALG